MKKLLFLGPSFDYRKGGAEYQYKILEQYLNHKYEIFYLFRHPTFLQEKNISIIIIDLGRTIIRTFTPTFLLYTG